MSTKGRTTPLRRTTIFCCIPVHTGVIVLVLFGIICGAGLSAIGCINLTQNVDTDTTSQLVNGVQVAVYTILALVSLFGLIGAIGKKRGLINLYFAILIGHLLFSFALGAYVIYRTFSESSDYMDECVEDSDKDSVTNACENEDKLWKGIIVSISIVVWLLEIWACTIVFSYSRQLNDEVQEVPAAIDSDVW